MLMLLFFLLADDEQSDFFHEPGPACGIPDIVPWWENERVTDEPLRIDSDFEKILTGTFAHLPKLSNQSFKARMGRLMSGVSEILELFIDYLVQVLEC